MALGQKYSCKASRIKANGYVLDVRVRRVVSVDSQPQVFICRIRVFDRMMVRASKFGRTRSHTYELEPVVHSVYATNQY